MEPSNRKAQGAVTPRAPKTQSAVQSKPTLWKNTKKFNVLKALADGLRCNRFYAATHLHDSCINSTVSAIQRDCRLIVSREIVPTPGHADSTIYPAEYWLEPDQIVKARKVLEDAR